MSASTGTPASALKSSGFASGSSTVEPSPASTYGDSIASDAGEPLTPMHDAILPGMGGLILSESLEKLQLSFSNAIDDDDVFTESKGKVTAESNDTGDVFAEFKSKDKGKAIAVSETKLGCVAEIRSLGDWRSASSASIGSEKLATSPSANRGHGNAKVPVFGSGGESSHHVALQEYASDDGSFQNFELVQQQDAQAIYPPSSCVFVANLLQSETDIALEVAVTNAFREYGTVFVKIRRDPKQMPFAFCQYTASHIFLSLFPIANLIQNDHNAERAIREGSGRLINGRGCRVEKAKAHRLFFIERKYGPAITAREAYSVLKQFGRINFCRAANPFERTQYNLNEGVIAQYALYNDGQAALQAYRNDDLYKIRSMANAMSPSRSQPQPQPIDDDSARYSKLYDADRRSIHVGNLPGNVTQDQVQQHFQECGSIVRISIHTSPSNFSLDELYAFAFIEFELQLSVEIAVTRLNSSTLDGKVLRVAQKDTRPRRPQADAAITPGYANTPVAQGVSQYQYLQTPPPVAYSVGSASPTATQWTVYNGWYCYWASDPLTGYGAWVPYCAVPATYNPNWYYDAASASNSPVQVDNTNYMFSSSTGSPVEPKTTDYMTTGYDIAPAPVWNPTSETGVQQEPSPTGLLAPASPTITAVEDEDRSATPTLVGQAAGAESA